jgi:hypothetical protein
MRVLEQQQAQELLSIPYDPTAPNGVGLQHLAVSAPTTPPRINAALNGEIMTGVRTGRSQPVVDAESLLKAVGSAASGKRKSVAYAPSVEHSPDPPRNLVANGQQGFSRTAGAKSMPASRRTSASGDDDNLAGHLQGLSLVGERSSRLSPSPAPHTASILARSSSRYGEEDGITYGNVYNAGILLDKQLDQEMHSTFFSGFREFVSTRSIRCHEEFTYFR